MPIKRILNMQKASEKKCRKRVIIIRFIIKNNRIKRMKQTGSNIPLHQAEEVACSSNESNKFESVQRILQDQEHVIQDLKRKCEALGEKQNLCEKELRAKKEKIQNLEARLSKMQKNTSVLPLKEVKEQAKSHRPVAIVPIFQFAN
ncbi:uncharacterized protein [Linepithema humile]|uniref:uncharacterized protein isoform X2 n=1 Tax=Linepithema humile TaxID=83485 RepID=UPI0006238F39|nr:PREDICTED: uncharacterized protein LOC105673597 isoform X2 [Linepithema humile]